MLNRSRSSVLPTFQRLQASMREFDHVPMGMGFNVATSSARPSAIVPPSQFTTGNSCQSNSLNATHLTSYATANSSNNTNAACRPAATGNWRVAGEELRRVRSQVVVQIERMLRAHQPHDVLTQVPENTDWESKTFVLALKIERLMFLAAPSRENYLNEATLRSRVQLLSRHLVRIRKRKNAMATLRV
jgi:hypothetical protein